MFHKKKFTFLPLVFATGLMIGACGLNNPANKRPNVKPSSNTSVAPSSSTSQGGHSSGSTGGNSSASTGGQSTPSSSRPSHSIAKKYIVAWKANGMTVQLTEVEEGGLPVYTGKTPTKKGDANSKFYRFKGWDRDLSTPITADTEINALFTYYENEVMIDDFEAFSNSASMIDAGWVALAYSNGGWTEDTKAAVSLGSKSVEGQKALRFDAWENNNDYKFAKTIAPGAFPNAANALRFRLMIPTINTVKVILHAAMTIEGKLQAVNFQYTIHPQSGEYVEYTIPFDDPSWALWGEAGKSIKTCAGWLGVHQDDIVNYLTKIEFYAKGNDGIGGQPYIAFLDSCKFITLKEALNTEEQTIKTYNTYTAKTADGVVVKLEIANNGTAVAKTLNLEENMRVRGKVVFNTTNMTFTSEDNGQTLTYVGKLLNGGQQVQFVSASGDAGDLALNLDFNAVQVVDNYEQYETDGKAYFQSNTDKSQRSGCRGAYYSEYYSGNGSSPWGGGGWSLLGGNGDQLKLKNDNAGHNGSKNYLCMKHSKSVAFRYMQWGLFDGTSEVNAFRGSKFSFWARTNGLVKSFKVSMFSQTTPTNQTKDSYVRAQTFEQTAAIGEWKHFEIDLNDKLTYYGFMIFTEKNTSLSANESWLYIDDVEVYSANPYATYVPPAPDKLLEAGQVFYGKMGNVASMQVDILKDNKASFLLLNNAREEATYTYNGNKVTFDFGTHGKYVANITNNGTKLAFVSATGDVANYFNGLDMEAIDVLDNAESYESSGTMWYQGSGKDNRSGARGAWYCNYYAGGSAKDDVGGSGWSLMGGNGDQLQLNTDKTYVHTGNNSLKMKRNQTNAMRYMTFGLCDGTATAHTNVNYLVYWAKNPNAKALVIKTSVYAQAQVTASTQGSNRQYLEAEIPANSDWTRVVIPLKATSTYYGVAFTAGTTGSGSADWFYVDDIMFVSADANVNTMYSPFDGLKLEGTIAAGAASITFGKLGAAKLTCAALGGDLNVTYQQLDQDMVFTIPALGAGSGSTLKGTFGPVSATEIGFTVTQVTGDLAPYVTVGTVLKATIQQ